MIINPTREEIKVIPQFTIYRINDWYVVRGEQEYGNGDSITHRLNEAELIATLEQRQHEDKLARLERIKQEHIESLEIERLDIESYKGFLSDNPMQRERQRKTFSKAILYNGKRYTRKTLIEHLVKSGWSVEGDKIVDKDGRFLSVKDVTKTGLDYASYLSDWIN